MMKKIVWASYGNRVSDDVVQYVNFIGQKYRSEIVGVYVKPTAYYEGLEYLPAEEKSVFSNWLEKTTADKLAIIQESSKKFTGNGLAFRVVVREGVPYSEILETASDENADLIAISKGKGPDNDYSLSRTTLKLIRNSNIPVLSAEDSERDFRLKRVLVPTGLYDIHSKDFQYALKLSEQFGCKIYHLNVINTARLNLPAEVINQMRGDIYSKIAVMDVKFKNVEPVITESVNPPIGILEFVKERDIDLVVMLSYTGKRRRSDEFIGSVAHKVVQESTVPVILMKP